MVFGAQIQQKKQCTKLVAQVVNNATPLSFHQLNVWCIGDRLSELFESRPLCILQVRQIGLRADSICFTLLVEPVS